LNRFVSIYNTYELGVNPIYLFMVAYQSIRVYFEIDADISEEQKEELVRMAQKYSPVFNTITKSADVSVQLDS
jgi:uncharacterized OsmC-like protein